MKRLMLLILSVVLLLVFAISSCAAEENTVVNMDNYTVTLPGKWVQGNNSSGLAYFKNRAGSADGGYVYFQQQDITGVVLSSEKDLLEAYESFITGTKQSAVDGKIDYSYVDRLNTKCLFLEYDSNIGGTVYHINGFCVFQDSALLAAYYMNPSVSADEETQLFNEILDGIAEKKDADNAAQISEGVKSSVKEESKQPAKTEILFRNIPWGTSYTETDKLISDLNMWAIAGSGYRVYPIDDIVIDDYEGPRFEYDDINIIGICNNDEISVAGYTTSDIELFFAYVPQNGVVNHSKDESALYGAYYEFEPKNLSEMAKDLKQKLTSQYGEPDKTSSRTDWMKNKYTYTFWYGANNTEVVLREMEAAKDSTLYKDGIRIAYAWLEGDKLLQNACDAEKKAAEDSESSNYGNSNTDGL